MSLRTHINTLLRRLEKNFITHNRIEVSQSAILHNLDMFTQLGGMQAIPVLKGNAYGHGVTLVARALKGRSLPYIAVDGYFEALQIREISAQPVLIMGAIAAANYAHITYDKFAFVVHDTTSIHALGATGKRIKVHLECNTGMNRYGAKPADFEALVKLILHYKNLELEGIMSHLADSDGDDPTTVDSAVAQFDKCVQIARAAGAHPTLLHVAQSAGSLKVRSRYANAFRLGVGLYGSNPFPHSHGLHKYVKDIQPALTLLSTITKVIALQKGDKVSYNYTFTAPHDMRIGVLPIGYYEGVNRALSNVGVVKVGKHFVPIVGRVCMNHMMIDLEGMDAHEGDEVVIYSSNPADKNTIDRLAHDHRLFNYGLLTALSKDVRRIFVP